MPPRRRDGNTQEAGDFPADGLRPAGRLLRRQQPEVLRETALVTPADGIDRRTHRGHNKLPLRRDSLPARRPARARRPRGAAPLALPVLLLPPVTAGFPHDANLRELRPRNRIPPDARSAGGHAEATPTNRGTPMGCYRAVPGVALPARADEDRPSCSRAGRTRVTRRVADLMTWLRSAWGDPVRRW